MPDSPRPNPATGKSPHAGFHPAALTGRRGKTLSVVLLRKDGIKHFLDGEKQKEESKDAEEREKDCGHCVVSI